MGEMGQETGWDIWQKTVGGEKEKKKEEGAFTWRTNCTDRGKERQGSSLGKDVERQALFYSTCARSSVRRTRATHLIFTQALHIDVVEAGHIALLS